MSDRIRVPEIVLASRSPRRAGLLRQVGIPFVVIVPRAVESDPGAGDFERAVLSNAEAKARSVTAQAGGRAILGADTIVELDGRPLGKPQGEGDARRMLNLLSGREHLVHSGIVLLDTVRGLVYRDHATTRVRFRPLELREIDDYIASGEPLDKAGAYGIQERGALFIERVEGCFFNVMGLPLARLWEMLMRWLVECGGK